MKKMHVRLVLDVFANVDDECENPVEEITNVILEGDPGRLNGEIIDVQVETAEITDSR